MATVPKWEGNCVCAHVCVCAGCTFPCVVRERDGVGWGEGGGQVLARTRFNEECAHAFAREPVSMESTHAEMRGRADGSRCAYCERRSGFFIQYLLPGSKKKKNRSLPRPPAFKPPPRTRGGRGEGESRHREWNI